MTASIIYSQASHQSRVQDTEGGMFGSSAQNHSAAFKTYAGSYCGLSESFLSTFEQIAKDHKPNQPNQDVVRGQTSPSAASSTGENNDDIAPTDTNDLDTAISLTTKKQEENLENAERPIHPALDLAEIVNLIEKLGYNDLVGGSGNSDIAVPTPMKAELDRLYRFLANSQVDKAASSMDLNVLDRFNDSRSTGPDDLNQLINKNILGQENRSDKPTVQTAGRDSEIPRSASQSGFRQTAESIKSAAEPQFIGIEAGENPKKSKSLEAVQTEIDRIKDGPAGFNKPRIPTQAKHLNRIPRPNATGSQSDGELLQQNLSKTESSTFLKIVNDAQATRASNPQQRLGGEPVQLDVVNSETSLVSKMIQDAQLAKENTMRMADATGDELGGKVAKVDAASSDSGLPGSQNQLADKAIDFTSVSRQEDTGQDGLKTQTLNQIVRKAMIYMRNGQHEAQIDLKPEFLGHVRMQITTENHQVTVKILTEFGFVKEMVENSIQQLKADLQQQGLNVDKLEVVISNDADEHKHSDEKSGQTKNRQHGGAHTNPENQEGETRKRELTGDPGPENSGKATVDYFA